ncbi:MAG: two-component system sensor histidine kinase NtrB [Aridibacter sp.]
MFNIRKSLFPPDGFAGSVQRLIFGRLALIFLLLLVNWWWTSSYLQLPLEEFPASLFLLFICSIGLTACYFLLLHINENYLMQIRIQFFIDIFLITLLVKNTGTLNSPYITLYVVLICVAGYFLDKNSTLLVAGLCSVCFTVLSVLTTNSLVYSVSEEIRPSRYLQIIAFNNVAILIVGLLASRFSERHKMSEQLRETAASFTDLYVLHQKIVELIPSGLIVTDLAGKIHSFNQAAEDISGFKAADVIEQSIDKIFGDEIISVFELCVKNADGENFPIKHFESVIRSVDIEKETEKQMTACSIAPLIGKTGEIYGVLIAFQDITLIRAMEEKIRRSDRLAAVGRMAAGLAHEIRNPLGSMSSALQFLNEKTPPATTEASLMKVISDESDRLNRIITNFLSYANPAADIFTRDEIESTDICETINDCLTLLRHSPEINNSHVLEFEMPESPVRIKANETQVKQVFWNLSRNSIQAMPTGGKLSVKLKEFADKNVQIVFEDTGRGISPDHLEHLFEPFSSRTNGTGLGLSIVHKIVSDHGGQIDVKSNLGKGTKITVELPF